MRDFRQEFQNADEMFRVFLSVRFEKREELGYRPETFFRVGIFGWVRTFAFRLFVSRSSAVGKRNDGSSGTDGGA